MKFKNRIIEVGDTHRNEPYLKEFEEHLKIRNFSKKTVLLRLYSLSLFGNWIDKKGLKLKDITKKDLIDYHDYLTIQGYKKASILSFMHSIKRYFEFLDSKYLVFVNPSEELILKKVESKIPVVLTEKEMVNLLNQPNISTNSGVRDRTVLEVFYATGIRLNELSSLDLNDVNLGNGTLLIRGGKFNKDRLVPLTKIAVHFIKLYLKEARPKFIGDKVKERALFVGRSGQRWNIQLIERMVREYAKSAKIDKKVTPHTLRHTCATHLIERDVDISYIQKLLGHSRVSITQFYTQVNPSKVKAEHHDKHPREKDKA